ncbi:4'-phosphopantetheinyl transferase superfamily protein [Eubacteriaceae bacterium ES2]|nr:4'-phosphopantetheinyl transferase superfamily protein [Eubacteriaceae bacterium ES2]
MATEIIITMLNIDVNWCLTKNDIARMGVHRQVKINRLKGLERQQSIALGYLIRQVLNYDEEKDISYSEFGQPQLKENDCFISFTHGGVYAAVARANTPVGIDIEKIMPYNDLICKHYFNQTEIDYVNNSLAKDRAFFEIWTRKESIMKADGRGFGVSQDVINNVCDSQWVCKSYEFDNHLLTCVSQSEFELTINKINLNKENNGGKV